MVRVISGIAKGRRLKVPEGLRVRPTSDKVKESLFNILAPDLAGSVFLDLFAGCGGVGIEALSRGASESIFIDQDPHLIRILRENIQKCGFQEKARVIRGEILTRLRQNAIPSCDIAFADPPYRLHRPEELLILLANNVTIKKFLIYEHMSKMMPASSVGRFILRRTYAYGDTALSFFEEGKLD